mmetsp:Transcript_48110/g.111397  ORF Transcript_48110/g.111397 Transcript_48110/m.111397 type:complete len:232 (+) Transcript_48110:71-766(+)
MAVADGVSQGVVVERSCSCYFRVHRNKKAHRCCCSPDGERDFSSTSQHCRRHRVHDVLADVCAHLDVRALQATDLGLPAVFRIACCSHQPGSVATFGTSDSRPGTSAIISWKAAMRPVSFKYAATTPKALPITVTAFSIWLSLISRIMILVCVSAAISLTPEPPLPMSELTHAAGQLNVIFWDRSSMFNMLCGNVCTASTMSSSPKGSTAPNSAAAGGCWWCCCCWPRSGW